MITTAYCTISEAQSYFDGRLNTDAWDDSSNTDRTKALLESTRRIDRLNFKGELTDEDQELQFPRDGDTEIPDDIICACSELALALLDGANPQIAVEAVTQTGSSFGLIRTSTEPEETPPYIFAGIPSFEAWTYLLPYLRDPNTVKISRLD